MKHTPEFTQSQQPFDAVNVKVCPVCNATFAPNSNFQRFCSKKCTATNRRNGRRKNGQHKHLCATCGETFGSEKEDAIYCSTKCYAETLKKDTRGTRKLCEHCQAPFWGDKVTRFCSRKCARAAGRNRTQMECHNCGRAFGVALSRLGDRKFCSRACWGASREDRLDITCHQCGKTFRIQRWYAENGRIYCSKRCTDAALINKVACTCATCGSHFERTPSNAQHGVKNYCSKECATAGQKKEWTDEQLRNLCQHDQAYGHYWQLLAESIRKRDKYICQCCGERQRKTTFHVHHIKPLAAFALADLHVANSPDNLISLCASCHKRVEDNPKLLNLDKQDLTQDYLVRLLVP